MADQIDENERQDNLNAADDAFRSQMRESSEPEAKAWAELDNRAKEQADELNTPLDNAYTDLVGAREERDQWREANERTEDNAAQWDEDYQKLDQAVADRQEEWMGVIQNASGEELESMEQDIDRRHAELSDTIAERQGIALLPSEREQLGQQAEDGTTHDQGQAMDDRLEAGHDQEFEMGNEDHLQDIDDQVQDSVEDESLSKKLKERREAQEEAAQDQDSQQHLGVNHVSYAGYATSLEDAAADRQLEEDQKEVAYQKHGELGTSDEVADYEEQRKAQEQGTQDGQEAEDEAEADMGRGRELEGPSLAELRAARNKSSQEEGDEQEEGQSQLSQLRAARNQGQEDTQQPNSTYADRQAKAEQAQEAAAQAEAGEGQELTMAQKRAMRQSSSMGQGM